MELIYADEDATETKFRRTIQADGSAQYSINGKNLKWADYEEYLKNMGVNSKARNFLVFQVSSRMRACASVRAKPDSCTRTRFAG